MAALDATKAFDRVNLYIYSDVNKTFCQDQDQDQDSRSQDQDQDLDSKLQDQDEGQDFGSQDQDQDQDFLVKTKARLYSDH